MKWLTPAVAWILLCTTIQAQQSVADSLEKIIATLKDDTVKVNRLNDLVGKLQYTNPAKAAATALQSVQLSEKINYPLGLATAYRLYGVMYVDRMVLDSGKIFYDKAYAIAKDRKEKPFQRQAGLITHNYGAIYHKKQMFDSATQKYLEAVRIFTASGQEELNFFPYTNLATIAAYLKDPQKSLSYAMGSHAAAVKANEPGRIAASTNNVMSARLELNLFDSVLVPLQQNIELSRRLQNYSQEGVSNNMLARYYGYGKNNYDSAVYYGKRALECMYRANNVLEIVNMTHNIGYYYVRADKFDSASAYLNKVLPMAESYGMDAVVQYSLENLVDLEQKRGRLDSAFKYMLRLYTFSDSLRAKQNRAQVNELEVKYEAEKKDNEINLQKAAIARKDIINYMLVGGAFVLLIIFILSYRNYRQKQKLQQQRINELEIEKQLSATEAILKGEEQERTRLAKDLHDGLGGMLSGVKYSLNTMKGNLIMTPDNAQAFERSMDMLDSSIREIRRVAHNMMPEALVNFGLDTALRDFCNDIDKSGALKVKYQSLNLENAEIDQTVGITIYRIVQELLNNTIKHAAATNAIVQVSKTEDVLAVTVEDDGKGFDTSILNKTQGIGWVNIQNRVEFLKGKMDVSSAPDKGTSVHIELSA